MLVINTSLPFKLFYTNMWIFLNFRELYFSDLFNTINYILCFFFSLTLLILNILIKLHTRRNYILEIFLYKFLFVSDFFRYYRVYLYEK